MYIKSKGICIKPTYLTKLIQLNPIQCLGLGFVAWWIRLAQFRIDNFFNSSDST